MLSVRNADMTQQSASSNDVVEEHLAFWGPKLLHVRKLCRCSKDRDKTDLRILCRGEYKYSSELELATCRLALRDIGSKPRHSDDERSTTASTATLLTMLDFCTLHCTRHFCATRAKGIFLRFSERLMARPSGTASSQSHVEAVRYQVHLKLSCSYSDVSTARSYPGNHSNGFTS